MFNELFYEELIGLGIQHIPSVNYNRAHSLWGETASENFPLIFKSNALFIKTIECYHCLTVESVCLELMIGSEKLPWCSSFFKSTLSHHFLPLEERDTAPTTVITVPANLVCVWHTKREKRLITAIINIYLITLIHYTWSSLSLI